MRVPTHIVMRLQERWVTCLHVQSAAAVARCVADAAVERLAGFKAVQHGIASNACVGLLLCHLGA